MSKKDKAYIVQLVKQIVHPYFAGEIADILIEHGMTFKTEPQTKADRIRSMSDEELARTRVRYDGELDAYVGDFEYCEMRFEDALRAEIEWLQQPKEEA